ncbi:MAG: penicillin acylase family protein [SAR202 cluster bacterium]|nr:penicillin acylase family protein [SAR202 cluster bacterium]
MTLTDKDALIRLGAGEPMDKVAAAAGMKADAFRDWFSRQATARVADTAGSKKAKLSGDVEIIRDRWGVPHIYGSTDDAVFFGYGYAMAQDRLFQLDYYRRRAMGTLSEVLGPSGLELDTVARTIGFNRLSRLTVKKLPPQTHKRLQCFSDGINAVIEQSKDKLPIEFALLDYKPAPWTPQDSVAVWKEFQWYLTGRMPVIAIPELAKRTLGDGPLYKLFLKGEADNESIIPPGSYEPRRTWEEPVGEVISDPNEGIGSNNWVVAPSRSASGAAMVASDPHIAFGAANCWYEAHFSGGAFNAVGSGYVGVPGILFGRNDRIAWGITNNICSQRDLYAEKTDAAHTGHFLYDGKWEKAKEIVEEIKVKGGQTVKKSVKYSRNGPIVDEILPAPLRKMGPVTIKWLGASISDEITSMLAFNQSKTASEARGTLKGWFVPTLSFVFADREGHIGYKCSGRLPIRDGWDRAFRPGWDPAHQWKGVTPFERMPELSDPTNGWIRTANNRTAPEDFPYPLGGTWSSGHRAMRIRQMLEEQEKFTREDFARMQRDVLSIRAVECVPGIVRLLEHHPDPKIKAAVKCLKSWDSRMEPDRVAASIFDIFFQKWCEAIAAERFTPDSVMVMAGAAGGIAVELLAGDKLGWFSKRKYEDAVSGSMLEAIAFLEGKFGKDMDNWNWGNLHRLKLAHLLSGRGSLGELLDRGGDPCHGNGTTVCNTGFDPNYMAALGANYRINADLAEDPPGLWSADSSGTSGNPGSKNYCDQSQTWLSGKHKYIPIDRKRVEAGAEAKLTIKGTA